MNNLDFQCEKQINVATGVEITLDVKFEPTKVGDQQGNLTITSHQAGDYRFLLKATGLNPQPQGPIIIKPGETKHVLFRNVFHVPVHYSFQVKINSMLFCQ